MLVPPRAGQAQAIPKPEPYPENINPVPDGHSQPKEALFANENILPITLTANYHKLLKDRATNRSYYEATLSYKNQEGAQKTIPVKLRTRGHNRLNPDVCSFPPIQLNFSLEATQNTLFAGNTKLKLVTHCRDDEYVVREYLVYKLYNILTDLSFRVRLCEVNYIDPHSKKVTEKKYAFLLEEDKNMATRNKATLVPKTLSIHMTSTDQKYMAQLAVFQYLIGNTDWSVSYRHNIRLLALDEAMPAVPVPYDFDYAGIVSTPYAKPPPELGISSVRERLFRGYTFPEKIFADVIKTFNAHKADFYAVYLNCHLLEKSYRKQTIAYLDSFYKIINDPEDFENNLVRVGQRNQKSYVVIKGLE